MPGQRGNSGGKKGRSGRKSKAEEMGLKALLDKCFTVSQRERCITQLALDSLNRKFAVRHEARKLLLAYTFGRPGEAASDAEDAVILLRRVKMTKDDPESEGE